MRLLILFLFTIPFGVFAQKQEFITSDIQNFWKVYDKIYGSSDTNYNATILNDGYIKPGSEGLKSLMKVRNYSVREYVNIIKDYPEFWNSIRSNTLTVSSHFKEITKDLKRLKHYYPELNQAPIYFSIGAFRTNGTVDENKVLIGCELALGDEHTVLHELPEWRRPFYTEYEPSKNLSLLCTHEYIHTQQQPLVDNLLSKCLYEGVAEFISCYVTGKESTVPAIRYGKENEEIVVRKFMEDLYLISNDYNWMWGTNRNELKERDLGYYIGYEICERFYHQAKNKKHAIKQLIELDYRNEKEVERIVDASGLLSSPLSSLFEAYEKSRPTVVSVTPDINGRQNVKAGKTKITVTFSEPLNGLNSGIDFGPMGEEFCPSISPERIWSEDHTAWTFEADLKPGKHYQILIPNTFRKHNQIRLKSYLLDFNTTQ